MKKVIINIMLNRLSDFNAPHATSERRYLRRLVESKTDAYEKVFGSRATEWRFHSILLY